MTQELILVAAVAANGAIGKDNRLLWHLPEDMQHFKALTAGHTVLMGRKTWESLPEKFRPLPGRQNIVVTRHTYYRLPGAVVAHTLDDAIAAATDTQVFIIGGAEVYAQALPLATQLEITEVDMDVEGDAFFPPIDRRTWQETAREAHVSSNGLRFAFVSYRRA